MKKLLTLIILAGFAGLAHAAWKYNPFTSRLDLVSDLHPYTTYENYGITISTTVRITSLIIDSSTHTHVAANITDTHAGTDITADL